MFICVCKGIREAEFCTLALCHSACPEAMKQAMGLDDSCCGRCEANLETMMQEVSDNLMMPSGGSHR